MALAAGMPFDPQGVRVGRTLVDGPRDLHRAVAGRLRYLQKSLEIVGSFFQAPDT